MKRRTFITTFAGFAVLGGQHYVSGQPTPAEAKITITFKVAEGLVAGKDYTDEALRKSAKVILNRLESDAGPAQKVSVRTVGKDAIEVILAGFNKRQLADAKRRITRPGSLEFAILANRVDHADIIAKAAALDAGGDLMQGKQLVAGWRSAGRDAKGNVISIGERNQVVSRGVKLTPDLKEFLVVFGPANKRVTGKLLETVNPIVDASGSPALSLDFNKEGGRRLLSLSVDNLPSKTGFRRRLAILLDDKINSAPSLLDRISDKAHLSGSFSKQEVEDLAQVLGAGELAVPLSTKPISEVTFK